MFPTIESAGAKVDAAYSQQRGKWERLYEVTQIKGTGEAHPFLSPNDEFASFEIWDKGNASGGVAKTQDMLQYEYAREALKNGLILESRTKKNRAANNGPVFPWPSSRSEPLGETHLEHPAD